MSQPDNLTFKIEVLRDKAFGTFVVAFHVTGLKDEKSAREFADELAAWMVEDGGWIKDLGVPTIQ